MRIKLILLFILGFFLLNCTVVHAQAVSKATTDSLKAARKHTADSLGTIRKYHDSKHYKDSVAHAKAKKAKALQIAHKSHTDSLTAARKHVTDSLLSLRKGVTDSVKRIQSRRTDSLAQIKKYKTGKRYADSVKIVRRQHTDSLKNNRKHFSDSIATVRKHTLDSTKAVRKHQTDSMKIARLKVLDSTKMVRKRRTDSLAKIKADKLKEAKAKEKRANDKKNLKLEIKMKQKHEAFTNKSMLKKKWRPTRRFFQNSFTHYNYYYNANRKMEEANQNMLRGGRKENYDSLIGLYPFDPNKDSALLSADMDSIIRKVSVGVQIHDPRVKWSNDMYLLLGEAYYYKGRYENAAIAFRYIISNDEEAKKAADKANHVKSKEGPSFVEEDQSTFLKHKSVHNDAILWLARTYTQSKQVEFAEAVLSLLASDPKLPEDLAGKIAEQKGFSYLTENNNTAAVKQLAIVMEDNTLPDWLRMRAAFLNGQLLQNMGKYAEASESFDRCLDFFPKIEMDFYARKYSSYNALMAGQDVAEAMTPLKKVLNDGKYVTYYDQVYYTLGKLSVRANKPDDAIDYLIKSEKTPKASKKQKALSFAALGDVYYSVGSYSDAKTAYDSAAKYAGSGSKDTTLLASLQRSKGLSEISGPAGVIHDQDSLMALSALSNKEQLAEVRRYLKQLQKQLDDSVSNAAAAAEAGIKDVTPTEPTDDVGDAGNWYFSNPTTVQQGSNDFKKKWGNRTLTDNWRRAAGAPIASGNSSGNDFSEDNGGTDNSTASGLPTEASLLAKIPNTKSQKEMSVKLEQRAYILLAKAYVKQLDDYKQALNTLDTLDARFPNHNEKEEDLYLRYQIALKQNDLGKAQAYSQEILAKFPESPHAAMLKPKHDESGTSGKNGGVTVAAYYEETYNLIMQHQYTEAMARINASKTMYDDPGYKKRFEVAEALSYAGQGDYNMADTTINKFMKANPSDSLSGWATQISSFIKDMRKNGVPSWYYDTIAVDKKIAKAAKKATKAHVPKPVPPPDIPNAYTYVPAEDHYIILVLPGLDSRTATLKQAIKTFDASKGSDTLSMLIDMYNTEQAVLIVKKFAGAEGAKKYLEMLVKEQGFTDYKPEEIQPMVISYKNYRKMYADKKPEGYQNFYNSYYK